jgi:hypothetical protein
MANFFKEIFADAGNVVRKAKRSTEVTEWLDEIAEALKREEQFRKDGQRCVEIYEAEAAQVAEGSSPGYAYNILYANTETLAPALYNSTPRPRVKPRFKDGSSLANYGSKVLQRGLEFLTDANQPQYTCFDDLQKNAVLEALVPGRGETRFKYEPTITQIPAAEEGGEPTERVDYETVCGESVPWNRMVHGYAKEWEKVPWVGYEHFMTREECIRNFGEEEGSAIELTAIANDTSDKKAKLPADAEGVKFAHIWEIWEKSTKKVIFISEGAANPIKTVDDPLQLEGFYPTPKPIRFMDTISSLTPKPLFLMYEDQAKELNSVTVRIGKLVRALKVRGFYDSTIQDIDRLMQEDDNMLLPAKGVAGMQQGQTLDKSIWLMPIERIVLVVKELYLNRQQTKSVIFEVTGIADIMRGSSAASETLGAQEIKQQWGTMRLKRMQKEVMRYSRDSLRIMAELAANHFSVETWKKMTGISLPMQADKLQAQQQMQMLQQQQMQAPPPQMPGQPPMPAPQPDPKMMEELQKTISTPSWEEVIQFLKNDLQRNFVIDIETNSTIDAEATEDKQDVAEFMNAMGQFLNGVMPLVSEGTLPFNVAKGMMISVVQRFRLGQDVVEELKGMQAPAPKPDPEQKKAEMEMKLREQDAQAKAKESQQKLQTAEQIAQIELETARTLSQLKIQEQQEKMQLAREKMQLDQQNAQMKMATEQQSHQQDLQANAESHQQQLTQNAESGQLQLELAARQAKAAPKKD